MKILYIKSLVKHLHVYEYIHAVVHMHVHLCKYVIYIFYIFIIDINFIICTLYIDYWSLPFVHTFSNLNYLTSLSDTEFISAYLGVNIERNIPTVH